MKIVVSYISSIYDTRTTVEKVAKCRDADGIHVDLMDGLYVPHKNFEITELSGLFAGIAKPLDIHLMVQKPTKYFNELFKLNPSCIYIHPKTEKNPKLVFAYLNKYNIEPGLVINPDEEIAEFKSYFGDVKRILLMSVIPGAGGQKFLENTPERLQKLKRLQKEYDFKIYIDGGINADTIKMVQDADGVVTGSFICSNEDFSKQIKKLREAIQNSNN